MAIISAEQLAARNNEAAKEDAAAGCAVQVQKLMKNPKAFDGDLADARVTSTETDGVVFLTYRSTNSYNAVTQGSALCKFTRNGTNTSITEVQIVKK